MHLLLHRFMAFVIITSNIARNVALEPHETSVTTQISQRFHKFLHDRSAQKIDIIFATDCPYRMLNPLILVWQRSTIPATIHQLGQPQISAFSPPHRSHRSAIARIADDFGDWLVLILNHSDAIDPAQLANRVETIYNNQQSYRRQDSSVLLIFNVENLEFNQNALLCHTVDVIWRHSLPSEFQIWTSTDDETIVQWFRPLPIPTQMRFDIDDLASSWDGAILLPLSNTNQTAIDAYMRSHLHRHRFLNDNTLTVKLYAPTESCRIKRDPRTGRIFVSGFDVWMSQLLARVMRLRSFFVVQTLLPAMPENMLKTADPLERHQNAKVYARQRILLEPKPSLAVDPLDVDVGQMHCAMNEPWYFCSSVVLNLD